MGEDLSYTLEDRVRSLERKVDGCGGPSAVKAGLSELVRRHSGLEARLGSLEERVLEVERLVALASEGRRRSGGSEVSFELEPPGFVRGHGSGRSERGKAGDVSFKRAISAVIEVDASLDEREFRSVLMQTVRDVADRMVVEYGEVRGASEK